MKCKLIHIERILLILNSIFKIEHALTLQTIKQVVSKLKNKFGKFNTTLVTYINSLI